MKVYLDDAGERRLLGWAHRLPIMIERWLCDGRLGRASLIAMVLIALGIAPSSLRADNQDVHYHGPVNLTAFSCSLPSSSFVGRVCYRPRHRYLVIQLSEIHYHWPAPMRWSGTNLNALSAYPPQLG